MTREQWLIDSAAILANEVFAPAGYTVPNNVRCSVGFPLGRRGKRKQHAIGQCWCYSASADKTFEIFISPTLDKASRVLDVIIHELVHAVVGLKAGHGVAFKRCALAVGLTGKMTATTASAALTTRLEQIVTRLGEYPHRKLMPGESDGAKKQGTRLIKLQCPGCGYIVRTTRQWVRIGVPTCPCGEEFNHGN